MNELVTIKIDLFEVDDDTIHDLYSAIADLLQDYVDLSNHDLSIYE